MSQWLCIKFLFMLRKRNPNRSPKPFSRNHWRNSLDLFGTLAMGFLELTPKSSSRCGFIVSIRHWRALIASKSLPLRKTALRSSRRDSASVQMTEGLLVPSHPAPLKIPLKKRGKKAKPSGGGHARVSEGRPDNPLALRAAPFVKGEYFHPTWRRPRLGGMKNS